MSNMAKEAEMFGKRIGELKKLLKIGRSRLSESLAAESGRASLQAQIKQLGGQLAVNREVFAALTGLPASSVLLDSEPLEQPSPIVGGQERPRLRPDVDAAAARVE